VKITALSNHKPGILNNYIRINFIMIVRMWVSMNNNKWNLNVVDT